jgi:hypothetical protein
MICESKIAVTKKLAQRFQRDDFCSRRNARKPNIIWLYVKNRSGGRWVQRFQRVYADDFRLRPGGAFASKPACSRALGQTRL